VPRVKVARPYEDTLEACIEAGSYCYTLVKCVKPFVKNEKGVIGVNDRTQGPPINSGSLVFERTHINKKRAPKAPV
jgi:hypothetical protein